MFDHKDKAIYALESIMNQQHGYMQRLMGMPDRASFSTQEIEDRITQVNNLENRQQEHLKLISRLTNETPYPDEIKGWQDQRAKLIARIGTLENDVREALDVLATSRKAHANLILAASELLAWIGGERMDEYTKALADRVAALLEVKP